MRIGLVSLGEVTTQEQLDNLQTTAIYEIHHSTGITPTGQSGYLQNFAPQAGTWRMQVFYSWGGTLGQWQRRYGSTGWTAWTQVT